MGINLNGIRSLLGGLHEADPDSEARERLIVGSSQGSSARVRAIALMTSELVRDPCAFVPGDPPPWLIELSRTARTGVTLLFDSRLADLAGRIVDDVVTQGYTPDQLVDWLERRNGSASSPSTSGPSGLPAE